MRYTTDRQPGAPFGRQTATRARRSWTRLGLSALALAAILGGGARAATPAGVPITNIASLTYKIGGADYGAASNRVAVNVGEIIDFSVTALGDLKVSPGATAKGLAFHLTNQGNADRAFALTLDPGETGDSFDPVACQISIERPDASGTATSQLYGRGEALRLAAGETVTVWAVCDIPADAGGYGRVALTARPLLATNDAAVPIWTPARATAADAYRIDEGLTAELVKSQSVVDPLGRPRAIKGATVTYSLAARLEGQGVAHDLVISDPIPAGSTYVPGSLRLDGVALTDGADADVGRASAEGVLVRLGDVPAPALRTVTFQVLITP